METIEGSGWSDVEMGEHICCESSHVSLCPSPEGLPPAPSEKENLHVIPVFWKSNWHHTQILT